MKRAAAWAVLFGIYLVIGWVIPFMLGPTESGRPWWHLSVALNALLFVICGGSWASIVLTETRRHGGE